MSSNETEVSQEWNSRERDFQEWDSQEHDSQEMADRGEGWFESFGGRDDGESEGMWSSKWKIGCGVASGLAALLLIILIVLVSQKKYTISVKPSS